MLRTRPAFSNGNTVIADHVAAEVHEQIDVDPLVQRIAHADFVGRPVVSGKNDFFRGPIELRDFPFGCVGAPHRRQLDVVTGVFDRLASDPARRGETGQNR